MCKILNISRSTYYYESNKAENKTLDILEKLIIKIFKDSRNNYGTRKIKEELDKLGYQVSRRKIGNIMKENGLVSNYTVKQYKVHKTSVNESKTENVVARDFDNRSYSEVVVSDLTYVRVGNNWNYICLMLDLHNREIIGYAAGKKKDAALVLKAFSSINRPLSSLKLFRSDRGSEFKNKSLDELLNTFNIERSLSNKGNPYDNAVAEATYKVVKTEFINNYIFNTLEDLKRELFDYVNWYNNVRIHGSLNYKTPVEYREICLTQNCAV